MRLNNPAILSLPELCRVTRIVGPADAPEEFETFGDDERLAREHAEYFYEEYLDDVGALP